MSSSQPFQAFYKIDIYKGGKPVEPLLLSVERSLGEFQTSIRTRRTKVLTYEGPNDKTLDGKKPLEHAVVNEPGI